MHELFQLRPCFVSTPCSTLLVEKVSDYCYHRITYHTLQI